jgi:hypothetical protein
MSNGPYIDGDVTARRDSSVLAFRHQGELFSCITSVRRLIIHKIDRTHHRCFLKGLTITCSGPRSTNNQPHLSVTSNVEMLFDVTSYHKRDIKASFRPFRSLDKLLGTAASSAIG